MHQKIDFPISYKTCMKYLGWSMMIYNLDFWQEIFYFISRNLTEILNHCGWKLEKKIKINKQINAYKAFWNFLLIKHREWSICCNFFNGFWMMDDDIVCGFWQEMRHTADLNLTEYPLLSKELFNQCLLGIEEKVWIHGIYCLLSLEQHIQFNRLKTSQDPSNDQLDGLNGCPSWKAPLSLNKLLGIYKFLSGWLFSQAISKHDTVKLMGFSRYFTLPKYSHLSTMSIFLRYLW